MDLEYIILNPGFSLTGKYAFISDEDAFISMDSHAMLAYFKSKGWECMSHPTFFSRIKTHGGAVIVKKTLGINFQNPD